MSLRRLTMPRQQFSLPTLNHLFFHTTERFRRRRLLTVARSGGELVYSTGRFGHAVYSLRRFLLASGLAEGDRVAILAGNRPEWHVADFAILLARGVVVPIYTGLAPSQVRYLLEHSGASAAIVSGPQQWEVLRPLLPGLPGIREVISMEAGEGVDLATAALPEIIARTPPPAPADWDRVRAEALSVTADTMASIVYTSGTTGPPKGVMLSHGNFLFDLEQCLERLQFRTARQALSVLPLSHVFERLLCYGYFRMGVPVAYGDPHSLRELFRQHKPVVMGCVPRILEKIQEAIEGEVRNQLAWKRRFFSAATRSGRASTNAGEQAPVRHRLLDHVARRAVSASVRRQLGGLRYFVCGGAWLNPAVEEFFRGLGFAVLQGYGLTETSPVIALNGPGGERPGTVGPRLEEVGLRLDESGEILTRGRHVMMGYYRDPEATAKVFRDGWLATGDLGRIDEQGYLAITGRRKDLLVLSTGKNVCPVFTERALERSRFVLHAFAVGHGRRFLAALIVPRRPALEEFARDTGNPARGFEELLSRPEVSSLFRAELETLQAELSPFEQAKRFCFLSEDALLDPQLVTPTQKVRRAVLEERYAEWIDRMYSQIEPAPALIPAGPDVAYGERDLTPRGL